MARTKRSAQLDSRNRRLALEAGKEHSEPLAAGCYLIYRRAEGGGAWWARWYDSDTKRKQRTVLGSADDYIDADGVRVLNWEQAQKKAGEWFRERGRLAHLKATGEVISDKPFTVADALADLQDDIKRRRRPVVTAEGYSRTRIIPALGDLEVGKLTRKKLADWHLALSESPRWRTGRNTSKEIKEWSEPPTEDQLRARQSTANRVLAILKRALNLAVENGRYSGATPWREVKPFSGVTSARVRFLTHDEQVRLLNVCPPDFRALVFAALHTGSRYAPLARLRVKDFNPQAGTLFIARDKGKGKDTSRHIALAPDAVEWFNSQAAGKAPSDILLPHSSTKRTTRKDTADGTWLAHDQTPAMRQACLAAGLEPITFHELRHTYASGLVNAGVPLAYVAAQLGHANTRMVEIHYGHLCPTALSESIRKLTPGLTLNAPETKVEALKISGRK